jgi:pilus assembly protein Flp/PilA
MPAKKEVKNMLALYTYINSYFASLKAKEEGQTLAEYALILVLIAIVVIVAVGALGTRINAIFGQITTALGG